MQSSKPFLEKVEDQARAEIQDEDFRSRVAEKKRQLRTHVPLLHKLFPWKIVRR